MSNDINKLTGIGAVPAPTGKTQLPAKPAVETKSSAIAISNHLDEMVAMLGEEPTVDHDNRVQLIKQQVSGGDYIVDLDKLADKLTQAALTKQNGI